MQLIYGFGELNILSQPGNQLRQLCLADFTLTQNVELFEYKYFDASSQVYKAAQPVVTSEVYNFQLTVAEYNKDLINLIQGGNSFNAKSTLELFGSVYSTTDKITVHCKDLSITSTSAITISQPITLNLICTQSPSYNYG
jgi:hypothetical protein